MSTYHQRAKRKRYVIYIGGDWHTETRDEAHKDHLLRLYASYHPIVLVLDDNQKVN